MLTEVRECRGRSGRVSLLGLKITLAYALNERGRSLKTLNERVT